MRSGKAKLVEYWEAVLKRIHIYKAKACLKEIHNKMLLMYLERLEQPDRTYRDMERQETVSPKVEEESDHDKEDDEIPLSPELIPRDKQPLEEDEKAGSFSPKFLHGDSAETCIICFHVGPPYEDIAFRIFNKEWEYSHKKGFKCTFEREILHVYFNFERYRYRR